MKKLFITIVILFPLWVFAQIPVGLNYQAIAWDNHNVPISSKNIEVMFEILHGTPGSGSVVVEFDEVQNVTTNEAGLFTLIIGGKDTEKFKKIDWTKTPKYLRVTIDKVVSPTTPMLSVPYAQYAERTNLQAGEGIAVAGNTISNTGDKDNTNEIQTLAINGNQLSLNKGGGSVNLPKLITNYIENKQKQTFTREIFTLNLTPQINVPEDGAYLLMFKTYFKLPSGDGGTPSFISFSFQGNGIGVLSDSGYHTVSNFGIFNLRAGSTNITASLISPSPNPAEIENFTFYLQKIN